MIWWKLGFWQSRPSSLFVQIIFPTHCHCSARKMPFPLARPCFVSFTSGWTLTASIKIQKNPINFTTSPVLSFLACAFASPSEMNQHQCHNHHHTRGRGRESLPFCKCVTTKIFSFAMGMAGRTKKMWLSISFGCMSCIKLHALFQVVYSESSCVGCVSFFGPPQSSINAMLCIGICWLMGISCARTDNLQIIIQIGSNSQIGTCTTASVFNCPPLPIADNSEEKTSKF